jgi:hypothetical protein
MLKHEKKLYLFVAVRFVYKLIFLWKPERVFLLNFLILSLALATACMVAPDPVYLISYNNRNYELFPGKNSP